MREKRLAIQVSIDIEGSRKKHFNILANYVSNLFTFNLPQVTISKTQKLVIEFLDDDDAFFIYPKEIGESIYTLRNTFPYNDLTNSDRKNVELLTDRTYQSLQIFYTHLNLNPKDVEDAYKNIIGADFKLEVKLCKSPKQNKAKTIKALITACYFYEFALIRLTFLDKTEYLLRTIDLFKTPPHYLFYSRLIHSGKWINDEIFQISNPTKEIILNFSVSGNVEIVYYPKARTKDGIIEEINHFTLERMIDFDAGKISVMRLVV